MWFFFFSFWRIANDERNSAWFSDRLLEEINLDVFFFQVTLEIQQHPCHHVVIAHIAILMAHRLRPILFHHRDFSMVRNILFIHQIFLCLFQVWQISCHRHLQVLHHLVHYLQVRHPWHPTEQHRRINRIYSMQNDCFVFFSFISLSLFIFVCCIWRVLVCEWL